MDAQRGLLRAVLGGNRVLDRLPGAVLLSVPKGNKGPRLHGWEKTLPEVMHNAGHLRTLEEGNIGVLLGRVSGGLCALDFDVDADADAFLAVNPPLAASFRSRGKRGCQVWLRLVGEFPASENVKDATGRKTCELRADGRQSIVAGVHPDGMEYTWPVDAPPLTLPFAEVAWPEGWQASWLPDPGLEAERQLIAEHGEPFTVSDRGKLSLNTLYHVARFARSGDTPFEPGEGQFYGYDPELGLWRRRTEAAIKIDLAEALKEYADRQGERPRQQLINARTAQTLGGLAGLLQGVVEEAGALNREHGIVHVGNGMLHLNTPTPELRPFAPEYRSRNVAPVAYDPAAKCPRFERELLASALDPADVSLVQRHFGACLLGGNLAQKLLILTGTAGGGKSTLLEILEKILGLENVGQLRTEHLAERFEIARFVGKLLLTGKDVPGRFLEESGAHALKALVGHDLLDGERKGSNTSFPVRGDFSVVITCNSRLRVRLDGDAEAWRRRLLIVRYERPKPERPERDFADRLLATEGAGILRWLVDGARAHLAELREYGDYRLTNIQRQRVNSLLAESDSVREFIRQRTESRHGEDVTSYELAEAYAAYCDGQGWEQLPNGRYHPHSGHHRFASRVSRPCRPPGSAARVPRANLVRRAFAAQPGEPPTDNAPSPGGDERAGGWLPRWT